ncbi:MAG: S-layer homology domain-containing protein [Clostridia bacterium]|nr:S-layer homology domain-containing protein [Clostridia bacterium]
MKKRFTALLLLMCLIIGILPAEASEDASAEVPKMCFADVTEEQPAYSAIEYLYENGVINGKSETIFAPEDNLTREELAKILVIAFELTETKNAPIFYDVPVGTWYAEYVQKLGASGLVQGISQTEFGTGLTLTRQDLAVILKRYLDMQNVTYTSGNTAIYADDNEISDYAREAVLAMSSCEVMPPRENNLWQPTAEITRAETAVAVYNAVNLKKKQADALGRYGDISQYDGPYDVPLDDRLAEAMPVPFDANIWPRQEIVYEDFEDDDFGILKKAQIPGSVTFANEGGYNSNGCMVLKGDENAVTSAKLSWKADISDLAPGDFLVLSAMVKAENTSGSGHYRAMMTIYNDQNKWVDETHTNKIKKDADWTEYQYILMVPEVVNALKDPEFFTVYLTAYIQNLGGTVYYDDFKLFKIKFDPMNTVLMTPNYKGIIKGDNGVGDISLRAYVDDLNGMWDLENFKYTAQITDDNHNVLLKSESDTVTPEMDIYFSSASLPMGGDYYLESILTYKDTGEQVQKFEWPLHKREADFQTAIGVDEYGRVTRNGEPYIPISTYNWTNYNGVLEDIGGSDSVDNLMHSGMGWYYNFGTNETYRNMVETLGANDKTVSLSTGSMNYSYMYTGEVSNRVKQQSDIRGLLSKLVTNFRDLPNLYSYYIFDEQNAARFGEEMAWTRKIIENYDLDHPTMCAIDNTLSVRKGIYAKTSDFLGYDPYPVTGKEDQNIAMVYNRISEGKKINPNRPVYAILQSFWYDVRGDLRGPTKEEFRNMAFQALIAGSCMLDAYGYRAMMDTPSPGRTGAEEWNDVVDVYDEIKYLEPILLSVEPAPYYEVKGGGQWLNTMAKRHDGKSYLFTVNNTNEVRSAMIYLDGVKKIKGMYSKKVYEADDNGYFEIEWDNYETEVFEFEQDDYKSPHAELTAFGLADAVIVDAESEEPSIIASSDKSEFEYCARISDYASLYINGEKVESTGKLNIDGLSQIDIKVVSEDERFVTEKTYIIKRS